MPTYVYHCDSCNVDFTLLMVPIEDRNFQFCEICTDLLKRKMTFTGSVWAPNKTGSSYA